MDRDPAPRWAIGLAASLAFLGLAALYVAGLRYIRESSMPGAAYTADERDALYLIIHVAALLFAVLLGFTLGKLLQGRGFAWAVLFAALALVVMGATMLGSRELACGAGHNDLVRHWEC
jgi:amino acid permease